MVTAIRPNPQDLAEAMEWRQHGDNQQWEGSHANIADPKTRAEGRVAETMFARWCHLEQIPHEWDGGYNGNPDFTVYGTGVGVRITALREGLFQPNHLLYQFDWQLDGAPERFYIGVVRSTGWYHILGGIHIDEFLKHAKPFRVGQTVCRGFVAKHDMHVATIGNLEPPREWLNRVRWGQ